ncbi:MAG: hypothetical protein JNK65_06360, partial [Deltaproteobacteria bacterium]|nr:hypothetical protein [Deltaproteobacteria bacterium]
MDTLERTEISRDEERFHPPVKYFKHVFEASIKVSEALKNFFDQNLISETNYQKALWQGGVFLNSKRLDE